MRSLPAGKSVTTLGGYELVLELAAHETTVLLARKTGPRSFSRWAAIRYVGPFMGPETKLLDRIDRDVERAAQVHHPCLLAIREAGALANGRFVVSDYVEGATLEEILSSSAGQGLDVDVTVAIACDMLAALHALLAAQDGVGRLMGIVHGRVTPKSVVVGTDGRTRLADLGLCSMPRRTERSPEGALETFHYDSPEVLAGADRDAASDIYSAGLVVYEMLAGSHPYAHAKDVTEARRAARRSLPLLSVVRRSVAADVAEVVARAVAADPALRYRTAEAFAAALELAARPASFREVGELVSSRLGARLEERRRMSSEWIRAHEEYLDRDVPLPARARTAVRIQWKRHRRTLRIAAVVVMALLCAVLIAIAWRLHG